MEHISNSIDGLIKVCFKERHNKEPMSYNKKRTLGSSVKIFKPCVSMSILQKNITSYLQLYIQFLCTPRENRTPINRLEIYCSIR